MLEFCTEYIAAGGNRHPSAADWNPLTNLLAFGSDRNVALWEPLGVDLSSCRFNQVSAKYVDSRPERLAFNAS